MRGRAASQSLSRTRGRLAAAGVVASLASAGCAGGPEVVQLPPMQFGVVRGEGGARVEALDPEALYGEATRAFDALQYVLAAEKYGVIADRFPKTRYGAVAAFNAGLSLEKAGRFADATARFEQAVAEARQPSDADDALLRLAACHEALEAWAALRDVGVRLLAPDRLARLSPANRVAAHGIRGRGHEGTGALALAERDYREVLAIHQRHVGDAGLEASGFVSLAQQRSAEIYQALFGSIHFRLPLERMERDLEDKSNFFLMAQNGYLKTLRLRHPDWATVAGFRLGQLYEQMYDDLMSAEVPKDLSREEVEVYYEELRAEVRPLLERAIEIYERNLRLGQRFGRDDAWVRKTEGSLARLKDILRAEAARAATSALD
jgi:tetratricopeptide (TPR) repeat protein